MNKTAVIQFAVLNREMNMRKVSAAKREAMRSGYYELAILTRSEYFRIHRSLDALIKKFGITENDIEQARY